MEDWFWREHLDGGRPVDREDEGGVDGEVITGGSDDDDDSSTAPSKTSATTSNTNSTNYYNTCVLTGLGERDPLRCLPLNIFSSLSGRLSDKIPAVRSQAAKSLAELIDYAQQATGRKDSRFWIKSAVRSSMGAGFNNNLRRRAALDDKATARKSAVTALVSFLAIKKSTEVSDIAVLEGRCGDSSIAVRKAAAEGITRLLVGRKKGT